MAELISWIPEYLGEENDTDAREETRDKVRISRIYSDWVRREFEEGTREVLEGKFVDFEELLEEFGVKPKPKARKTV